MVGGGACNSRGREHRWWPVATSASRRRAKAAQLAVVGTRHAHRRTRHNPNSRPSSRSCRPHHTQPEEPKWNRLGYGNNAIQEVPVRIQ